MFKFSAIVFDLDCQEDSNFFCSMFAEKLESDVCEKIWSGVDEDDIIEQITESTGWCVESFACEEVFEGGEIKGDGEPDEVKVSMKLDALLDTYYEAGFDKEYILGLLIQVRDVDFCKEYFPEFYDGEESEGDGADGEPDDVKALTGKVNAIDISDPSLADFKTVMLERLKPLSNDSLKIITTLCSKIISGRKGKSKAGAPMKLDRDEWFGAPEPHYNQYGHNRSKYNADYHSWNKWNKPTYKKFVGNREDVLKLCKDKADKKLADKKKADDEAGVKDDDDEAGAKGG